MKLSIIDNSLSHLQQDQIEGTMKTIFLSGQLRNLISISREFDNVSR